MASRYWVGGGTAPTSWSSLPTTNWSATSGGAGNASNPAAGDDVFFDGSFSGDVILNVDPTIQSLDMTGYTGTYTANSSGRILTIAPVSGTQVVKLAGTFTPGASTIRLNPPAGTTINFTTNGKSAGNLSFGGTTTGTVVLLDNVSAITMVHTSGTVQYDGPTNNSGLTHTLTLTSTSYNMSSGTARTITFGTCTISCAGGFTTGNQTNLTLTANTATAQLTGSASTFNTLTFNGQGLSLLMSSAGAPSIVTTGTVTLATVTRTGTAVKTDSMTIAGSLICTDLNLNGNSVTNRILVSSTVTGTQASITVTNNPSVSNADFMDISGLGTGSWNLSAITGGSGDAQGNSNITFTTPATQTATGTASFTWSTHGWTTRVPLPQDDVVINNAFIAGRTITQDMPRAGKSINFTGTTGNPAFSVAAAWAIFGSLTLVSGMTATGSGQLTFAGRSSCTVTMAGVSPSWSVRYLNPGGTVTQQDAMTLSSLSFTMGTAAGTWDTNGFNLTCAGSGSGIFFVSGVGGTLTMTNSTLTSGLANTGTFWVAVAGATYNTSGSTIVLSGASANVRTFAGAGKTYATLQHTVAASTGVLAITGANTFSNLKVSGGARTLRLPSATTTTIPTASGWQVFGTSGNVVAVDSSTATSAATLAIATGTVSSDWITVQDNTASGNTPFYAGSNSTLVSNTTNWLATSAGQGNQALMLLGVGN